MKMDTLGELVRQYREKNEVTMGQLQDELGINKGVISKIEKGDTRRPEFKTIFTVADALSIPYRLIIDRYVNVEDRPHILHELLEKSTTEIEFDEKLIRKLALKYLESDRHETEDALSSLFQFTSKLEDREIQLILYITIAEYARLRGIPPYIAKGLLQVYFIQFLDIQKDKQTYHEGKEILHYIDFLEKEEKREFYFKMSFQAYALEEYEETIQLTQCGLAITSKPSELEARAYGTMINAYFDLKKYEEVEKHLHIFEKYQYNFIKEFVSMTYANMKAKQKEYNTAIPLLEKCYKEIKQEQKIHCVNELFNIYIDLNDLNSIRKLIQKEDEYLPTQSPASHQYKEIGKYHLYKGNFKMNQGYLDEALSCYGKALEVYTFLRNYKEIASIYHHIISSCIKNNYQLNTIHLNLINVAAKIIEEN
ncbi:helix-turn-helix domain-containing protein [Longirhabdus pacifica]|uniref:helix-turn-helix domain-containing protein n=1 Tax=Longirhabdus pacifica TaxID=2305227 RepID=UPI00100926FF|nr:helix-turn-helix transcriptional regulator [Longirhabdus pacifica]